jgi:hypothetical protein
MQDEVIVVFGLTEQSAPRVDWRTSVWVLSVERGPMRTGPSSAAVLYRQLFQRDRSSNIPGKFDLILCDVDIPPPQLILSSPRFV